MSLPIPLHQLHDSLLIPSPLTLRSPHPKSRNHQTKSIVEEEEEEYNYHEDGVRDEEHIAGAQSNKEVVRVVVDLSIGVVVMRPNGVEELLERSGCVGCVGDGDVVGHG